MPVVRIEKGRRKCDWKNHQWSESDHTLTVFVCMRCDARMTIKRDDEGTEDAELAANRVRNHRRGLVAAQK